MKPPIKNETKMIAAGAGVLLLAVIAFATLGKPKNRWNPPVPSKYPTALNLDRYCKENVDPSSYAELVGNDAFSWKCNHKGQKLPMALNDVCKVQHPKTPTPAYDQKDPYSWHCE